jgi:Domain of unknown function (DUF4277)
MQIEVLETVTKTIGALALAYPYLRRLGVAETIDALVTAGKERMVPTGQVIEVLILNRLSLRPVPISKIGAWAQTQAIEEVYGLAADALNADRIGRALDEIHPHLVDLWAALVLRGASAYCMIKEVCLQWCPPTAVGVRFHATAGAGLLANRLL